MIFLLFLLIVLDEYLNLYYCTWENFQMLHKMYILNGCLEDRRGISLRKDGERGKTIFHKWKCHCLVFIIQWQQNFSPSSSGRKHCILWFISKKQLIIKCLLWWIYESSSWDLIRRNTGRRWFFTRKLIIGRANSFAVFERRAFYSLKLFQCVMIKINLNESFLQDETFSTKKGIASGLC